MTGNMAVCILWAAILTAYIALGGESDPVAIGAVSALLMIDGTLGRILAELRKSKP